MFQDPGMRRFIAAIASMAMPIVNSKLGLGLSHEEVTLIVEAGMGYVLLSNGKEVMVKRAEAAGVTARNSVTKAEAPAIIDAAIADGKETPK